VPTTGFVIRTAGGPAFSGPVVRMHIGLEDVDDLIADLKTGLAAMTG
jgi:cystathionine beta-lyase